MGLFSSIGKLVSDVTGGDLLSAGSSLLGGSMTRGANQEMAQMNTALQKEFAQNGIRWKVEDAKAAGVHPLYALGANTASFAPVSVGDTSMGTTLANVGQDIGSAINRTRTGNEKAAAQLTSLAIDKAGLENDLLRSQIARMNQTSSPGMPSGTASGPLAGQGDIQRLPSQIDASDPSNISRQAGDINTFRIDTEGGIVPSERMKNAIDDDFIGSTLWHIKNRFSRPPLPDGRRWNALAQRYEKPSWFNRQIPGRYVPGYGYTTVK